MGAGCHPLPTGAPWSGITTNQFTRVGPAAPKAKAAAKYPSPRGHQRSTEAKMIPQIPPQKEAESHTGTPRGQVGSLGKGLRGVKSTAESSVSITW